MKMTLPGTDTHVKTPNGNTPEGIINLENDRLKKNESLRFNTGKTDWTILDYPALKPMVDVLEYGAHKYSTFRHKETGDVKTGQDITKADASENYTMLTSGRDNWKIGFKVKELIKSLMRHTVKMICGEVNDSESGLPHVGHAMCNLLFISYYLFTDEGKPKRIPD